MLLHKFNHVINVYKSTQLLYFTPWKTKNPMTVKYVFRERPQWSNIRDKRAHSGSPRKHVLTLTLTALM